MSQSKNTYASRFFGSLILVGMLALAAYGIIRWMGGDTGSMSAWIIGMLVVWWLIVVVTLPWDLHFKARGVLHDAQRSRHEGVTVSEGDLKYVARWAGWSLVIAIALHVISAVGLGLLQVYGISRMGYLASGAALLLMGVRPAVRAYEYLVERLTNIGREVRFPRDDVLELRKKIDGMENEQNALGMRLDLKEAASWAATLEARLGAQAAEQERLRTQLEDLRRLNDESHRQLAREAEAGASRMAEDGRVLNQVRELVRFFKEA